MCDVEVMATRQLYHVSLALVMGFIIVTRTVDGSTISRSRYHKSAGNADNDEKKPGSHEILSIKKRSPVLNPLFPVKVPLTYLASELYGLAGGKILGLIPGKGLKQELFWAKKVLASLGK